MRCRRFSWCGLGVLIALLAAPVVSPCAEPSEAKKEEETKETSVWRPKFDDSTLPEGPPPAEELKPRPEFLLVGGSWVFAGSVAALVSFHRAAYELADATKIDTGLEAAGGRKFCAKLESAGFCHALDSTIDRTNVDVGIGVAGLVMAAVGGGLIIRELMRSPGPMTEPKAAVVVLPGSAGLWVIGSF